MEDSIFTKIIKGELPCHKVYEDERVIAFLTIQPFAPGHTLVVPKKQVSQIWDLDDDEYANLLATTKKIALHMREATGEERVGMAVKGFDVPHVHIHLVPMSHGDGRLLDLNNPAYADDEELATIAATLHFS